MTMILELPAHVEARLNDEARLRGVAPAVLVAEKMSALYEETPQQRRLRIKNAIEDAQSYFSQFPPVGDLLEEKHADVARENARSYGEHGGDNS